MFVPEENLLGAEHQGFYLIMANFQWERLLMALGAVGAMQVCFEQTASTPSSAGRSASRSRSHQAIRHKLAEIAITIEAGRDVTYAALRRHVAGEDAVREVTIAKLRHPARRLRRDRHLPADPRRRRVHEGDGIERALRDARLGPIGGGTDEIMKEILGRSLGL